MIEVHPEAIALGITIGKQPRLEHAVRRETDTGHHVGRGKRRLFDFGEVVLGVAIELHGPDFDQRELAMRPDLGQVERVVPIRVGL
ncbi:hypothetical protein D3C87_1910580 [compost metagenome]